MSDHQRVMINFMYVKNVFYKDPVFLRRRLLVRPSKLCKHAKYRQIRQMDHAAATLFSLAPSGCDGSVMHVIVEERHHLLM